MQRFAYMLRKVLMSDDLLDEKMKHERKWQRTRDPGGPLKFESVAISSGVIIFHSLKFSPNANPPHEISAFTSINTLRSNVFCLTSSQLETPHMAHSYKR